MARSSQLLLSSVAAVALVAAVGRINHPTRRWPPVSSKPCVNNQSYFAFFCWRLFDWLLIVVGNIKNKVRKKAKLASLQKLAAVE